MRDTRPVACAGPAAGDQAAPELPGGGLRVTTDRPFAWLADRGRLRSNLADLERSIRAGRLDAMTPEHRAGLEHALAELADAPDLSARARHRLASVLRALGGLSR
jgi:hypothetical protein